ncbi:hypothetical protein TQ29_02215 [Actibacterium sp. EMB200-NS6]|uniref:Uncharacterized protein n=1 Tax=Actibacterium naphthalenivorans TaxID=1614693 RepID=A0A840C712_9RHOB|nr:hypothetical protein TQ29_02215 [Actibacterium sp. EMB200-NS6]MBB4021215.1 hypothetical protein [Actibacterium naphthalenivorans]
MFSPGLDPLDQGHRIIAAVGHDMGRARETVNQLRRGGFVTGLAGAECQPDRQAHLIHDRVDLGTQSATRATDGVIRAAFFLPAACWWARMMEEAMKAMVSGDFAAKATDMKVSFA